MIKDQPYIIVNNASYRYKQGIFELVPFSLNLYPGEAVFITGPNGSGKSTLGKLLAGIYKPLTGKVLIQGEDTRLLSLGQIGKKIGYLWQKPELQLFAPNVKEELTFTGKLLGKDVEQTDKNADYWLEYFEIRHLAAKSTYRLSRGEKQRLALAASISTGASYMILDEPTTGLDSDRKNTLLKLLGKLRDSGTGLIVISHDTGFVEALADRIIILKEGKIADDCAKAK